MISCDECQKKIAMVLDNEGSEGDDSLISEHVKCCSECEAFRAGIIKIRQGLVSDPVPPVSLDFPRMRMLGFGSGGYDSQSSDSQKERTVKQLPPRFRRLAWLGGLAAAFVVISSSLGCLFLARRVVTLERELQIRQQSPEITHTGERSSEQERQQKAIMALFLRMAELEDRVEDISPPTVTFIPTGRREIPNRRGNL